VYVPVTGEAMPLLKSEACGEITGTARLERSLAETLEIAVMLLAVHALELALLAVIVAALETVGLDVVVAALYDVELATGEAVALP